jgi:SAM-dependent methyltransferase
MEELPQRFIQIDEEGFALMSEIRTQDPELGAEVLSELEFGPNGCFVSRCGGVPVIVEAFDEPYVASQISLKKKQWILELPYDLQYGFELSSLSLDEWDRFHGLTEKGLPFVMSRKAQAHFFNLLEEFDDDSITFEGETYEIPAFFSVHKESQSPAFWSDIYKTEETPRWDLSEPAEALKDMLPRLKMPKSRVLVLGCGEGHDAAFFAQSGHVVTAVDFSAEALQRARKNYGHLSELSFVEQDVFKLDPKFQNSFDIVFEHTCYCAVNPTKRAQLVKIWKQCLHEQGHLMGVFFVHHKTLGPPYGGSEWELRQRLKDSFHFVFWGRWQKSIPRRQGKELFVYAQRKSLR